MTETFFLVLLSCACPGNLHHLPASSLWQVKQIAYSCMQFHSGYVFQSSPLLKRNFCYYSITVLATILLLFLQLDFQIIVDIVQ